MPNFDAQLRTRYQTVKSACASAYADPSTGRAILTLARTSFNFFHSSCIRVDLISRVHGKTYIAFSRRNARRITSRPVNTRYFLDDFAAVETLWNAFQTGSMPSHDDLMRLLYSIAIVPCVAMELFDRQNKKGPATYFECLIGHIFARVLACNPRKRTSFVIAERPVRITMDFLFDPPGANPIHLAVKMSTRERIVQAWAHQRMLDSAYGSNTYRGIMVLFSETKLDSRSREVVEICVPDQWLAYQSLLAKMETIYYFDIPCRYEQMGVDSPGIIDLRSVASFVTGRTSIDSDRSRP